MLSTNHTATHCHMTPDTSQIPGTSWTPGTGRIPGTSQTPGTLPRGAPCTLTTASHHLGLLLLQRAPPTATPPDQG